MGQFRRSSAAVEAVLLGGDDTLEVVGEQFYMENIWRLVGGRPSMSIRRPVEAVLVPEPDNPYDSNAVVVLISGLQVGHLSRDDAVEYGPGLRRLYAVNQGKLIALAGLIFGAGDRLGVFLDHDPADFGVTPKRFNRPVPELRTGLSEAIGTDHDDESYDLSWLERLPRDDGGIVRYVRSRLAKDRDPISRHYLYCHLQKSLYKLRELSPSMLPEFDEACRQHDAEMDRIHPELLAKFGAVPVLETYRQAAIRHQKARNWQEMRRWAERGLSLYGDRAARAEAVEDLQKRAAVARAKLEAVNRPQPRRAVRQTAIIRDASTEIDHQPLEPPAAAPLPSAGWYPDPAHRFDHRWWDGARWTAHVASGGRATVDA